MNRDVIAERAEIDQAISRRTVCSTLAECVAGDSDSHALKWPVLFDNASHFLQEDLGDQIAQAIKAFWTQET